MSPGALESYGRVVDLEWDPETDKILAVGWADDQGVFCQLPGNVPPRLREDLAHGAPLVEFSKGDAVHLLDQGWHINGPVVDLQVAAWVLDENQLLNLESVVNRYLRRPMDKRLIRRGGRIYFVTDEAKRAARKLQERFGQDPKAIESQLAVPISQAPRKQLRAYCRRDVEDEVDLLWHLLEKLERRGLLEYFFEEEVPFTRVLIDMERAGIPIDLAALDEIRSPLEAAHAQLASELTSGLPAAFNLNSPDQIAAYIFDDEVEIYDKVPVDEPEPEDFYRDEQRNRGRKWAYGWWKFPGLGLRWDATDFSEALTEGGNPSTARPALLMNRETRKHPWVLKLLEYKKIDKLLTTYLRKFNEIAQLDEDGKPRIYCHFNQTGTRTGRLSSSDPNMQNVPKRGEQGRLIRRMFRSPFPDRPFLTGDYSQLESRLMAHFSGDPFLMQVFLENRDLFIELGSKIFGKKLEKDDDERSITKNLWYAQGYGAWPPKIAEMLSMEGYPTEEDTAADLLEELQDIVPVYFDWRDDLIELAHEDGYVETLGGRRRRIDLDTDTDWKITSKGERAAANAKVQGSAADIVRRLMIRFHAGHLRLLLQVHDEVLYEYLWKVRAAQREHDVRRLKKMAETGHGFKLDVPLVFEPKITMAWMPDE